MPHLAARHPRAAGSTRNGAPQTAAASSEHEISSRWRASFPWSRKAPLMISLKPGAHVHLIGIAGTAMSALAGLLQTEGYRVTGSDAGIYPPISTLLADLGISVTE